MAGGGAQQRVVGPRRLAVDDIDATLKEIEAHGGKTTVAKMPVGDMGFAAYFTDPEGNVMGLWETASLG